MGLSGAGVGLVLRGSVLSECKRFQNLSDWILKKLCCMGVNCLKSVRVIRALVLVLVWVVVGTGIGLNIMGYVVLWD